MGCGRNDDSVKGNILDGRCVCDVVRAIKDIQDQMEDNCGPCQTSCFNTPLGGLVSPTTMQADTRVFMLLTKDGTPFKAFFRELDMMHNGHGRGRSGQGGSGGHGGKNKNCFSIFFRVEDIFDKCCATLRVLQPLDEKGKEVDLFDKGELNLDKVCDVEDFELTNSCITVDLDCFCAVQCFADVFIGVCD